MNIPKISIGTWAFSFGPYEANPWLLPRVLEFAADAGYDGVELNGFPPHPDPDSYDTPEKCRQLMTEIADYGLGVSGYGPTFGHVPPAEVDQEVYVQEMRKCLAFCENCGIDILRVDTVSPPDELPEAVYDERFQRLTSTWRAAADEAQRAGVTIVWEFEPGFWLNKPSEVLRTVQTVGHDHFRLLFDTSHAYMGAVIGARQTGENETLPGGVAEYARLTSDWIGHFHLIDSDGSLHDDETSTHTPFGQGHINFKEVLAVLEPVIAPMPWWCVDFCFHASVETDGKDAVPFIRAMAES